MKLIYFKTGVSSVFLTLIGTVITYAQPPQGPEGKKPTVDEIFKQMDTNKDNKLSKKEIKGPLSKDFAKVDTDKDGYISKEELNKAPKPEGRKPEEN